MKYQRYPELKLYLACRDVISLVDPATSMVLQTLICLNIYSEQIKEKKIVFHGKARSRKKIYT